MTTTATPKQFLSMNAIWTARQKKKGMFTHLISKYVFLSFGASAPRGNVECSVEKRPDNLRCKKGTTRRRRCAVDGRATERTIERMCLIRIVFRCVHRISVTRCLCPSLRPSVAPSVHRSVRPLLRPSVTLSKIVKLCVHRNIIYHQQ